MSDIKALDKLREVVRCGQGHGFSSAKAYYEALDGCITEIEREVSERFVELPCDEDGVLIHVGDMVQGLGDSGPVQHLELWDDAWVVVFEFAPGQFTRYSVDAVRHVKPRTIEDVLRDCCNEWNEHCGDDWESGVYAKYAEEIREMMA